MFDYCQYTHPYNSDNQMSMVLPDLISPQPINLYFFSSLRLKATFSPSLVQIGMVSFTCMMSSTTLITLAAVSVEATLNLRISYSVIFLILWVLLPSPYFLRPSSCLIRQNLTLTSVQISGRLPTVPSTLPTILSLRVILGSISNPTPISPPGTAYSRWFFSASSETTLVLMGVHLRLSLASLERQPGLISTSIPSSSMPSRMLPPTTPPLSLSISVPGLLTSKLLMMIILAGTSSLRLGMGISQIASRIPSMLQFICADIGIMGAFLHIESFMNYLICLQFNFSFSLSLKIMSILFCKMIMCSSFIISSATRCSAVWG